MYSCAFVDALELHSTLSTISTKRLSFSTLVVVLSVVQRGYNHGKYSCIFMLLDEYMIGKLATELVRLINYLYWGKI